MASTIDESRLPLTMFLLKKAHVGDLERKFSTADRFELSPPLDGYVLQFPPAKGEPPWAGAIRSTIRNATAFSAFGESPSAMMIVRFDGHTFVLTFGHAASRLDDAWLERDFGRRVVLNSIKTDKVLEIHLEQVFAKWHVARERAPRAASVNEFGVEFDRDLVARVEGVPRDTDFWGGVVRGSTSFRLKFPISELAYLLTEAAKLFSSRRYRSHWPDIDNISPVDDPNLTQVLDQQLDQEMADPVTMKRMVMLIPLRRQDEDLSADSYVYGRRTKNPVTAPYLLYEGWANHVRSKGLVPNLDQSKNTAVHIMDKDQQEVGSCSAYECFGYEIAHRGRQYILSSGLWYEIATNFISLVNSNVRALRNPQVLPPAWDGKISEGQYNLLCGKKNGFMSFDAKNIPFGGGQSKVEFCDTLHFDSRTFYFAKIPSRSSGMSHLVEQVRRTVELTFGADSGFRQAVQQYMSIHYRSADVSWLKSRPLNSDWTLCLVSLGKKAEDLPFFARCSVRRLAIDMQNRGFKVVYFAA
jgi:uncharacterized protein (TIGR04141 family)